MSEQPKPKAIITDIKAIVSEGNSTRVSWTIGEHRFHVWMSNGQPDETVFKNPMAPHELRHTQKLNRISSKATATMFAEVWAVVERDDLLGKADRAAAELRARNRRKHELEQALSKLEQQALNCWKNDAFDRLPDLRARHRKIENDLLEWELSDAKG